ncbi:MAG TPA: hypothetical protein VN663_14425 [Ramlibacter sp.]|jgi:hypothetical protein|nr:hypothetical protein [Ramlibacter sp.]
MQKYQNNLTDAKGNVLPGASVQVLTYPGLVVATIYSDNGVTPQTNPIVTGTLGDFSFYAADSRYALRITGSNISGTVQVNDILLEDPADGSALTVSTLTASGNISTSTAGAGLRVKEGSNAKQGVATLTAGSVVVANTSITASSRIQLTSNADGGTPGFLRVSARSAGVSFTITSSSGTDTSTVAYEIFEPG